MGFLKRSKVPSELPDLIIDSNRSSGYKEVISDNLPKESTRIVYQKLPRETNNSSELDKPNQAPELNNISSNVKVEELSKKIENNAQIRKQIEEGINSTEDQKSFFDKVLQDINGEIKDLGKLEEWYEKKFLPQDVVSNMKLYWEDNKADMMIKSFGQEYKEKINQKIKNLQELEADWREVYFRLVKKEEEMKKEEKSLKDTLSEFVDLCRRRKVNG